MNNLFEKYNHLPIRQRVERGKKFEEIIDACLKAQGRIIKPVSEHEDMVGKIDRVEVVDGAERKLAYKARTSGNDILLDLYEPFYGIDNTNTQPGRDYISPYDRYFCLERGGGNLREIDGAVQKLKVKTVLTEWTDCSYHLSRKWFNSVRCPGISLNYHVDKNNGRPKLIMFISPNVYKEGEEIWFYKVENEVPTRSS